MNEGLEICCEPAAKRLFFKDCECPAHSALNAICQTGYAPLMAARQDSPLDRGKSAASFIPASGRLQSGASGASVGTKFFGVTTPSRALSDCALFSNMAA